MFFSEREVIQINNDSNFLVLKATLLDNEAYYQVQEVDLSNNLAVGDKLIITAINNHGELFIEDVTEDNKLLKLNEIFAS